MTSSTRKSSVNALAKLFEVVAKSLDVSQDDLEAVDQRIRVRGNPDKGMSFVQACQKLGVNSISEMGANEPAKAPQEGLNTGGVGGVQMADVSVDIETGIVRDESPGRCAGLRAGGESEDGREPGVRRLHHEHLRRAV